MLLNAPIKEKASISITPLIDVVFILLLFFMLSSTFQKNKQIQMNTSSLEGISSNTDKSHKILLDIDNMLIIDGIKHPQNSQKVETYLQEIVEKNEKLTLVANPKVKTQKFIELLDSLRNRGVSNLNISKTELP